MAQNCERNGYNIMSVNFTLSPMFYFEPPVTYNNLISTRNLKFSTSNNYQQS